MATPVWTTTAGKIATIDEQVAYSLQLEANTSDSTAITYSVIAGSLPPGMQVTTDGLLTGTPAEVAKRTLYTFVVRATAGAQITDRTFSLDVQGADTPTFTTASGQLQLDDSTSGWAVAQSPFLECNVARLPIVDNVSGCSSPSVRLCTASASSYSGWAVA